MPVLTYSIHESILMCTPHTPLREVIIYMGQPANYVGIQEEHWRDTSSCHTSQSCQSNTVYQEFIPVTNNLVLPKEGFYQNPAIPYIDCIYVIENRHLLGIFSISHWLQLINAGINWTALKVVDVMKEPLMILEQYFDATTTLTLMCQSGIRHLAIVDNLGQLKEIVTTESLTLKLQKELSKTREQLQSEIAQRCALEIALKKAELELKINLHQSPENITETHQLVQTRIGDRIVKEPEKLLNYSDLNQNLHQIFPDFSYLYLHLENDGKILSYHTKETSELHLPTAAIIDKPIQDIMPFDVGRKFHQAILQLQNTKSLVTIDYSLSTTGREENFEAWLLRSSQHQIIAIIRNITESKLTENKLKSSLKEKEVLLKEIHHRVKNNLQVISSLLRLQAKYTDDEQAFNVLQDSQNRVRAMAMIHENLYRSNDLAQIEIDDYIQKLTNNLIWSYGVDDYIKIHLNIDKILLKINTAIPCGLIINELISNAIKHAFKEENGGDIYVSLLDLNHGKYSLKIRDNGRGLEKDIESYKNQSLGLQLVWNLVEQLEGDITFNQTSGTEFTILFLEKN